MSHPITFQGSISGHNVISGVQANSVNFYLDRPNGLNFGDSLDFNDVPQIGRNLQSAQVDTSVDLNIPDKSDSDFKIPFSLKGSPRIGSFVGRLDHLALLEEYHLPGLSSSYNCNMQQIITIISGLGGIGKTQLALQFAKLHANAFTAIFWISAETKETLQAGFLSIMERAQRKRTKLTINNEELRDQALKATYAWLNHPKNARWLLILDNVDDNSSKAKDSCENNPACDIITQCLDELNHGNIIITTRLSHLGQLGRTLHLDRLGLDDSIQVLRSTIGRHTRDNEGLGRLAARLDGLPLTLNYAGCYMAQKQVTPLQYLEQYEKEIGARKKILQHIPRLSSYNKSMVATWEMSLRAVNEEDALAVTFLEYCSFLYHSDIFYELFQSKNFEDNDLITKCTTDREYFQDLIEILANFSFIRLNDNNEGSTENGSYSIHPVVQDWMRDRVEVKNWAHTLSESISLIGYAHLRTKFTNQSIQRRLVPHADRCILLLARFPYKEYFLFSTLFLLGDVFLNIERTGDAEDICHMALEMYKSFNVESPSEEKVLRYVKIQTKVTLGAIYLSMQKLDLAEKCFLNLVVDPNNSDYLGSGLNLARIFSQRHEYHRADSALTMILEQLNKRLGLQGSVSNSFGEDASFTTTSGHYGQVTEGAQTDNANTNDWPPNEVEQKVDDKWLICDCIRMMADNARKRGSFDEAKEYINLALRLIKKLFGQETRQTVSCLTDLGRIYKYEGKLKESQKALSDAIETAKTVFEGTNTAILKIKGDLVDVLCDDGQYELAESSSRDILQKSKQLFGEANPKTLFSLSNLSVVLGYRGKFDEAEDCARNAFEGLLDTLDWDHANLRNTAITLAVAYGQNNKLTEAKTLFKQVLDHLQQDLPEHIESIVSCLLNLAQVYRDEKQITHSENTYREAIEKYGSKLRHGHITVLHASLGLASLYIFELFDIEKARPLITDVYELCQKTLDRSHPISSRARTHYELLKKLDNVKSNETKTEPQKTLPITYHLTCGNPNSEDILSYAISETAPAVLLTGSPTDPKAEQRFVQSLIDRHHLEKFNAREWRCVVCNLPASDMVHRVNALLRQGIFATGPASAFEPTVVDFAIPVCELYGKCDQIAFEIGSKKLMEHFPIPIASQKECAQCSAKDNLKMCTSCKMARYCSVECQKVAWPSHKMFCKFMKSLGTRQYKLDSQNLSKARWQEQRVFGHVPDRKFLS